MLSLPLLLAAASAGAVGGLHCAGMCGVLAQMLGQAPRMSGAAASVTIAATTPQAGTGLARVIAIMPAAAVAAEAAATADILAGNRNRVWRHHRLRHLFWLHAGRLGLYALLGALVGALGAGSLWLAPLGAMQRAMFVGGNLALILLGLRLAGNAMPLLRQAMQAPRGVAACLAACLPAWLRRYPGLMPPLPALFARLRRYSQQVLAHGARHPFLLGLAWGCLPCGLLYAVLPFALLSASGWAGALLMLVFGLASLPHLLLTGAARHLPRCWQALAAIMLCVCGVYGLLHADMQMAAWLCVTPQA